MRISDWSSDVCSSDLKIILPADATDDPPVGKPVGHDSAERGHHHGIVHKARLDALATLERLVTIEIVGDRKRVVSGKSVSDSVDLGGSRIIKKKQNI